MGLSFIHDAGLIHRDIKPENLLVDHRGDIRISDFGCAYLHTSYPLKYDETYSSEVNGTWHYMAPELLANDKLPRQARKEYGLGVDYWSLGCVFFELVAEETGVRLGVCMMCYEN